jgi:hypothetical protein
MKLKSFLWKSLAALTLAAVVGSAAAATAVNTRLVSNLPLGNSGEVWAEGNFTYVARGSAGLSVIDSSNPAAPVLRSTILPFAHARISDVQVVNGIAYLANEITNGSPTPWVGMFIYDVRNPSAPVELGRLEWGAGGGYHLGCDAHSVTIDVTPAATNAYLSSGITGDVAVFDVSNPAVPVYLTEILSPVWAYNSQAHDVLVRDGRAYIAWLGGGFTVHDVSNPSAPVFLAHQPTSGVNTEFFYHLALSTDGQSLLTTGESSSAADAVKVWNISNLAAISLTGIFTSPNGAVPHQIAVLGRYAYVAWLTDGLRVLDISNPAAPVSVGWYDADTFTGTAFVGGFSVFPTATSVFLSHTSGGLYTLDLQDTITITKADWKNSTKVLTVEATSTGAPSVSLTVAGFGVMTYNSMLNNYSLTTTVGTKPASVTVTSDIGGSASASVRRR